MHSRNTFDALALALIDLVSALNSPRQDDILLRHAGVSLDRALFPLLVRIGFLGALNIAELTDQVGRDHSTVSRQVSKLESMGLVRRRISSTDQRAREAEITAEGRSLIRSITRARRQLLKKLVAGWSGQEIQTLADLNRRLADAMKAAQKASA